MIRLLMVVVICSLLHTKAVSDTGTTSVSPRPRPTGVAVRIEDGCLVTASMVFEIPEGWSIIHVESFSSTLVICAYRILEIRDLSALYCSEVWVVEKPGKAGGTTAKHRVLLSLGAGDGGGKRVCHWTTSCSAAATLPGIASCWWTAACGRSPPRPRPSSSPT